MLKLRISLWNSNRSILLSCFLRYSSEMSSAHRIRLCQYFFELIELYIATHHLEHLHIVSVSQLTIFALFRYCRSPFLLIRILLSWFPRPVQIWCELNCIFFAFYSNFRCWRQLPIHIHRNLCNYFCRWSKMKK